MLRTLLLPVAVLSVILSACGEEEPKGPPMSKIFVKNESSTEASVRVKFWTKVYVKVPSGESVTMQFVPADGATAVQVAATSRNQWDALWVTLNVGQTIEIFDATERIGCRPE